MKYRSTYCRCVLAFQTWRKDVMMVTSKIKRGFPRRSGMPDRPKRQRPRISNAIRAVDMATDAITSSTPLDRGSSFSADRTLQMRFAGVPIALSISVSLAQRRVRPRHQRHPRLQDVWLRRICLEWPPNWRHGDSPVEVFKVTHLYISDPFSLMGSNMHRMSRLVIVMEWVVALISLN